MKLLVIEDEHKIANAIRNGFEQEGFSVDVAYTGTEGRDLAIAENYDVMIIDRMLPEFDGLTIIQEVRSSGKHTPILLLTALGQTEDKVMGLNLGADDYLTKPFSFSELVARVRALGRRPHKVISSILKVEDLTLDPLTFRVKRKGQEITLSKKEFMLLEYLMRHSNQIVTKEQIMNNVWDYDANVMPNSVEVYIKHLRDKIDNPFKNPPLIHTARGFGYKIGN